MLFKFVYFLGEQISTNMAGSINFTTDQLNNLIVMEKMLIKDLKEMQMEYNNLKRDLQYAKNVSKTSEEMAKLKSSVNLLITEFKSIQTKMDQQNDSKNAKMQKNTTAQMEPNVNKLSTMLHKIKKITLIILACILLAFFFLINPYMMKRFSTIK